MPFDRPTLATLVERARNDLESRLEGTDAHLRDSAVNALATMHAGGMHGAYGYADFLSRQIIPTSAEGVFLDRWVKLWLPDGRKAAAPAKGALTLTGVNGTIVPAGTTIWQRSDGVQFIADAEVTIALGTAIVAVTAVVGGTAGNTEPGTAMTVITPIAGLDTDAIVTVDGLANGTDIETDPELLDRLIFRIQNPPAGGNDADYVAWAREVPGVTRAWPLPQWMGAGTVGVTFVLDNQVGGIIPNPAKVAEVQAYIDARAPMTATVIVFAPTAVPINVTIDDLSPDTPAIRAAVEAELGDLILRNSSPGKTVLISKLDEAISSADGEEDHLMTVPAANVTLAPNEIAVPGVVTWL